ncbi:hypothetical protein CJ030_MR2G023344 [Morella rubra]|uniref:Uncharacterized protein n=1 Tax=Morella rubra TaxID=262757 RepID=A0A6A1WF22_9ROSI|nr:hypothetical protein CJ030_MR2G023344 [Morella rubra]
MATNGGGGVINIGRLASSIEEMMSHNLLMSRKCCIFRVPNLLYRQNKEAFTPNTFSIGPLHPGHPNLKATEQIKFKYPQCLIARSFSLERRKIGMIDLISSIKQITSTAGGLNFRCISPKMMAD